MLKREAACAMTAGMGLNWYVPLIIVGDAGGT
jgi:hypothetical protein